MSEDTGRPTQMSFVEQPRLHARNSAIARGIAHLNKPDVIASGKYATVKDNLINRYGLEALEDLFSGRRVRA